MSLVHSPWSPTPDDPQFLAWVPGRDGSDSSYFYSMVTYADKKIGEIVAHIHNLNLDNNTVIVIAGDNGTAGSITSMWNNQIIEGAKRTTGHWATSVPLFVRWAGVTRASVDTEMISFVDFMPTISNLINFSIPLSYGTVDGVSFLNQLNGGSYVPRDWLYFYWGVLGYKSPVWAQTKTRKLYSKGKYY
jgi:arylsulfatase A